MDARVGPYRILRLINDGGQGRVFLGYDDRLRRRVAIKIYPLPTARSQRQQLLREARQVAAMQSQKVVQVYDVIESGGHLALVMEYVPGCDLEELLSHTRPSLASSLRIASDIAGALAVARQQRIVHSDLKAANVLITQGGRAKLTDFGIARGAGEKAGGGSPSAISPEQLLGSGSDLRSDLFALGRLLYRLLTGEDPFMLEGRLDLEALRSASYTPLVERLPPDVELPPVLLQLVSELLQADPSSRPDNTHHVRHSLRKAMHSLPLSAEGSLRREAQPYFRPESPQDVPPPVPEGVGRQARSRLRSPRRLPLPARWRVPALLAIAGLVVVITALYTSRPIPLVRLEAPLLQLHGEHALAAGISGHWLSDELASAVQNRLGRVRLTGAVVPREYHAGRDRGTEPDERLLPSLRCGTVFCVFALERSRKGRTDYRQALLFADDSQSRWRQVIYDTTSSLYD